MKRLGNIIVTLGLFCMLASCADTAYQSGRVDQLLRGEGTVTKQDLREMKRLDDQRKSNQDAWDTLDAIIDTILLFKVF